MARMSLQLRNRSLGRIWLGTDGRMSELADLRSRDWTRGASTLYEHGVANEGMI